MKFHGKRVISPNDDLESSHVSNDTVAKPKRIFESCDQLQVLNIAKINEEWHCKCKHVFITPLLPIKFQEYSMSIEPVDSSR